MSDATVVMPRRIGRRVALAFVVLAASIAAFAAISAGSVSQANAEQRGALFCPSEGEGWLGPWQGDFNGRCDAPDNVSGYNRTWSVVYTNERAGCTDYADVWHNIIDSWRCAPSYSQASISIRQDGGWYRGIIRNNNTSHGGYFHGLVWWNE